MTRAALPDLPRFLLALPPEASTASRSVDGLHMFVIGVTMFSSVAVAIVAFYWVVRYRQRHPNQLTPKVQANVPMELGLAGFTLGLFILFWVIGYLQYIDMEEPPDDATPVYVTAKQWMWKFSYPGGRSTNDTLVVPAGRPVKLVMTSRDVIHSFYVPEFRVKQDVLPGRYTITWFRSDQPGQYSIYCAEYCGLKHSLMLGSVRVMSADDYARWLDDGHTKDEPEDLVAVGRSVAVKRGCVACHTYDGQRHIGPSWARLYGSYVDLADGRRVKADEAYLTRSMMEPGAEIVAGYPNVMPAAYRDTLSAPEVGALVELIKALKNGGSEPEVPLPAIAVTADGGAEDGAAPSPKVLEP